ncbi:UPF0496 protein 4 [Musa acuminata AAA Group]|uniref:UPF0496 protein 4 n=1 Tax=Musa acuminata AAA Group TaxID=214697 RepID=UPI0031DF29DF
MSRPHDGQRIFFHFGNPFRVTAHKGSSRLLALLSSFEQNLAENMRKLRPKEISDVFSLSWTRHAIKSISEVHTNIKALIMELQFPVSDWDENWIDMYLDSSVKVLDICNALSAELTRLDQSNLLLRYVLHILDISTSVPSSEQLRRAHVSLDDWLKQTNSTSHKLESCHAILQTLQATLCLSKVKNSAKGRVLMRALYGVEVMTLFTCSVIAALLTGCSKPLMDMHVADGFLWLEAFNDLQSLLNQEIRSQLQSGKVRILKEMEALKMNALMFHSLTNGIDYKEEPRQPSIDLDKDKLNTPRESYKEEPAQLSIDLNKDEMDTPRNDADSQGRRRLQECMRALTDGGKVFGHELDSLSQQVNDLFQVLLTGRDALLCNLRTSSMTKNSKLDVVRL